MGTVIVCFPGLKLTLAFLSSQEIASDLEAASGGVLSKRCSQNSQESTRARVSF